MTTNYTITNTTSGNRASVEIYFDGKPAEHIRTALKAEGFRWQDVKKCWYGYTDPVTADAIIAAAEEDAAPIREGEKAPKAETAEKREKGTPQAHPTLPMHAVTAFWWWDLHPEHILDQCLATLQIFALRSFDKSLLSQKVP